LFVDFSSQVQTSNHRWGRVGHLPGSILINTGELLASWTNDMYPALVSSRTVTVSFLKKNSSAMLKHRNGKNRELYDSHCSFN
jgi:hypothetical protein